ncbi:nucleotidyltransferase domain-containing protein [Infirmifilum lucidum]|uniref:Nucleotidyltransferase domain-containing protein n=1 Tax=Infirmifilum lucidum TaxID=2776706 RepID=A0A7L9FIM9_9CREN|nr:nucleotidyltransferase domain-containing protein [Infirmifilum lucidum]
MPEKSWSSAGVRLYRLDREKVVAELRRYARDALRKGALLVVLVGSLARGDYTAYSDADVVVVLESSDKKPHERIPEFLDPTLTVDVNPFVYTLDEILDFARSGRRVVKEVLEYGVVLEDDERLLMLIREAYELSRKLPE